MEPLSLGRLPVKAKDTNLTLRNNYPPPDDNTVFQYEEDITIIIITIIIVIIIITIDIIIRVVAVNFKRQTRTKLRRCGINLMLL